MFLISVPFIFWRTLLLRTACLILKDKITEFIYIIKLFAVSYSWPNGWTEWTKFFEGTHECPGEIYSSKSNMCFSKFKFFFSKLKKVLPPAVPGTLAS